MPKRNVQIIGELIQIPETMSGVECRLVPGYEGRYAVGNDGIIWSCVNRGKRAIGDKWWMIKQSIGTNNYKNVVLSLHKLKHPWCVHTLVLTVFVGHRPSKKHQCRHLDGNPLNNHIENLAWGTARENYMDRIRHGTNRLDTRGSECTWAKLKESDIVEIHRLRAQGYTLKHVSRLFGISRTHISSIESGRIWKHVPL